MKVILSKLCVTYPLLAFKLGGRNLFKIVFLYIKLVIVTVTWKCGLTKNTKFTFEFNKIQFTYYLQNSTDIASLEEIYIKNEYAWDLPFVPSTILDLGANYGDTALYYHIRYPQARIYAVEASLKSFERLKDHVKNIPQIIPVHAAVTNFVGTTSLYLMSGSNLGNSLIHRTENTESISVPAITLPVLSQTYNDGKMFDLVTFDIEGAEEKMFLNLKPEQFSKAYIGEIHYDLTSWKTDDVRSLFEKFNLEVQEMKNKSRVIIHALCK